MRIWRPEQISHAPEVVKLVKQKSGKAPQSRKPFSECKYCGRKHEKKREKCPAYNKTCDNCGMKNHFSAVCQQKARIRKKDSQRGTSKVHEVHEEAEEDLLSDDEVWTLSEEINSVTEKKNHIHAALEIEGNKVINMQIDTGATCNVIPKNCLPQKIKVKPTKKTLITYTKSKLHVLGTVLLTVRNPKNDISYTVEFVVVDSGLTPLIGAKTAQRMELVTVQYQNIMQLNTNDTRSPKPQPAKSLKEHEVLTQYQDLFTGLGKIAGELHLEVDESVKPVVMPPRRVPVAVKRKLREELDRLESLNVLKKEEEPTAWVSALVATMKSTGKVRVCIDPQRLNTALKRSHYPLPVIDEILPELAKAKVFTKADLKDGFLQIQLDEESSKLTTFQTPWGRYRWLRMPYGISPAPEYFQQKLDQCLENLTGV